MKRANNTLSLASTVILKVLVTQQQQGRAGIMIQAEKISGQSRKISPLTPNNKEHACCLCFVDFLCWS